MFNGGCKGRVSSADKQYVSQKCGNGCDDCEEAAATHWCLECSEYLRALFALLHARSLARTHARTHANTHTHTLRHLGGPKLGVAKGIAHKLGSERREITRARHALEMRHDYISTRHVSRISTGHISHISMGHDN